MMRSQKKTNAVKWHWPSLSSRESKVETKIVHKSIKSNIDQTTQSKEEPKIVRLSDTPLSNAVDEINIEKVKDLLAKGVDVNEMGFEGYPLTKVLRCVKGEDRNHDQKCFEIAALLLEHKADPYRKIEGVEYNLASSALHLAIKTEIFESVKRLLPFAEKKDQIIPNPKGDKVIPWYAAMIFDKESPFERWPSKKVKHDDWIKILKLLKSQGADLSIKSPYDDKTNLFTFILDEFFIFTNISKRRMSWLEFILENCPKDFFHDLNNSSHVHFFFQRCSEDFEMYKPVIDLCLKYGFDINSPDNYCNRSLLHYAVMDELPNDYRKLSAVRYFISRHANANVIDKFGMSPLYHAKSPETAMELIKAGADVKLRDKEGLTPLDFKKKLKEKKEDGLCIAYAGFPEQWSLKDREFVYKEYEKRRDNFEKVYKILENAMKLSEFANKKTNLTTFGSVVKWHLPNDETKTDFAKIINGRTI